MARGSVEFRFLFNIYAENKLKTLSYGCYDNDESNQVINSESPSNP